MTTNPGPERVAVACTACGGADAHPKHYLGEESQFHLDCHADLGCAVCSQTLASAPKTARHGDALILHLTKGL